MPGDDERTLAMLTSRDEQLRRYLRDTPSPDDVVRSVTTAFAGDVARIMSSVQGQSLPTGSGKRSKR